MRTWRTVPGGGIVQEGIQTGDGRVIALGALTWEKPEDIPLQWNPDDQSSHNGTLTVGAASEMARGEGGWITASGPLDDEGTAGQEIVRLQSLDPPLATGLSIVLDDVAVEIVSTQPMEEDIPILIASARSTLIVAPDGSWSWDEQMTGLLASARQSLTAAAGEPDPEDAEVLFEDAQDAVIERVVRGRIRAMTLVDVPAFIDARVVLDGAGEVIDLIPVAASAAPPRDWYEMPEPDEGSDLLIVQPNGSLAVPLTITAEGQVYGHAAYWGQCHVGYPDGCQSPPFSDQGWMTAEPTLDDANRVSFHTGHAVCSDGSSIAVAPAVVSANHPDLYLFHAEAMDEYAHTGLQWCSLRVTQGKHGIWCAGALNPGITPEQLVVLRASSFSGDWRHVPGFQGLQLIALLTVNRPGFPIAREAMAASGLLQVPARVEMSFDEEGTLARVSGLNIPQGCHDCGQHMDMDVEWYISDRDVILALSQMSRTLKVIEGRTRHLIPVEASARRARLMPPIQD